MKKLFFSLLVAIFALGLSAFTTTRASRLLTNYWAILADGNYHRLATFNSFSNCYPTPAPSHCAVLWTYSGPPNTDVLPVSAMNQFVTAGFAQYVASPWPSSYSKYVP